MVYFDYDIQINQEGKNKTCVYLRGMLECRGLEIVMNKVGMRTIVMLKRAEREELSKHNGVMITTLTVSGTDLRFCQCRI